MSQAITGGGSREPSHQPLTSLMSDIVADVQELIEKHLVLFHRELRDDFARTQSALTPIIVSVGLAVSATVLMSSLLVGLLSWAVPEIHWWGWCGILGTILGLTALVLYAIGRARLASFNPAPDESLQAVKESFQCIRNPSNTTAPILSGKPFAPK